MGSKEELKRELKEYFKKNPDKFAILVGDLYKRDEKTGKKVETLANWQRKFMFDDSKRILVIASRQVGKTTITAIRALWKAWLFDDQQIMIVSDTGAHAKKMFMTILEMLSRSNNILLKFIKRDIVKMNLTGEILFSNGSRITSKTAGDKGDPLRGYTLDLVIVDEAQLVPNEAFAVIEPTLWNRDGQLILLGTPPANFRNTYFYQAYLDALKWRESKKKPKYAWSLHKASPYDRPWLLREQIERLMEDYRKKYGEAQFKREVLGEFYDEDASFFNENFVKEAMKMEAKWDKPLPNYEYVVGIDPAGMGTAKTAISVIAFDPENPEEPYILANYYTWSRTKPSMIVEDTIKRVVKLWKPIAIVVDSNGLGLGVYDGLDKRIGQQVKVYPFKPHGKTRMEMYFKLREKIEDGRLLLPDDKDILDSFLSFEYKVKANGDITVVKKPGHADIVDSIGMAVWYVDKYIMGDSGAKFVFDEEFAEKFNEAFNRGVVQWDVGLPRLGRL